MNAIEVVLKLLMLLGVLLSTDKPKRIVRRFKPLPLACSIPQWMKLRYEPDSRLPSSFEGRRRGRTE